MIHGSISISKRFADNVRNSVDRLVGVDGEDPFFVMIEQRDNKLIMHKKNVK